jgi:regulator of replication initiation timing
MATLTDMRQQMDTQFNELKQDVQDLRQDCATLHSELRGLREEVTELRRENDDLKKTNNDLSEKLTDYERRMDDLEGRSKRNNLIFYGLPRGEGETSADCEGLVQDLLTDKLDITRDVEFDRVHRLSSRPDSPVIARCVFYKQKVTILKAKGKLRGTDVLIGEDFTKGVRDIRRKLAPHLKKARQDGKRATMVFNHLLIDGGKFSVDASDRLVELR